MGCRKTVLFSATIVLAVLLSTCRMFSDSGSSGEGGTSITSLTLAKSSLSMKVGGMDYVAVSIKPLNEQKNARLNWSYDSSVIKCDAESAWGVTITALKEGQTSLKCSYGGYEATCIITVSGFAENYEETVEPYIYSNTSILQTAPGITEKVYVSLYGGSAADIDGYTWTCDNASVCSIQPTGQYCMITAKDSGYARIKVTHQKATYPYYIGIYVFADATEVPYITTGNNIVTMRQGDSSQTVTVSLVNGKDSSLDSQFNWEIVSEDSSCPIGLERNGNKAVITPLKGGTCTLRVTHPDAAYPLEILCRVLTVVKNVYINPSSTVVNLYGEETHTLTCSLENITAGSYDIDAYEYSLDDWSVAEIVSTVGKQVVLRGKANGSCKLLISHEKAAYTREVLVIVNGQLTDAIDSSYYITTSQNYIRTKVGAEGTSINISLKGGEDGDESEFSWSIKSTAADGSAKDVVSMDTAHGTVNYARSAMQTYAFGKAFIEPKCEGTAIITISHPKVHYPTEILVKVLSKDAILEEPLYFVGSGLLKILNGSSAEYTVQLKGENKSTDDDGEIKWECDNPRIKISASANVANVAAPSLGSGSTISNITISHNKADADKKVLVMTADDQKTLDSMKALYSDKLYYNINVGESAYCMTSAVGFDGVDEDGNYDDYDFSSALWTVKDPSVASVSRGEYPLTGIVTGLKAGKTTATVSVEGYSCDYDITVLPEGARQTESEVYFTTGQNVVIIEEKGKTANVSITAVNLPTSKHSQIKWESSDEGVAKVVPNGSRATVTAVSEGEAVISVAHEESQNTLKIYVRVGSEYVIPDAAPVVYISAQDVITMLKDDAAQKLTAILVNYDGADTSGFSFEIDNEEIASISSQSTNGIAYVKPVSGGQAEVTITHKKTDITKKVLIVVGNSAEELAGFTYLTTSSNVVAVGEGNTRSVSVSVKNSDSVILDGYSWSSSNPSAVGVTATGATAVLTGNSIGTSVITVKNSHCQYPLQIIAQCVDPIAAAASPYIQLTSSVITANVGSGYTNVTADLVGGSAGDYSDFEWTSNDSSICAVYGQNEVGKLRALKAGTAYITVSHPKAAYSAQLLVVCDEIKESECYISVPASIVNMKPTDSTQQITASLINGTATDKYSFSWSLDVYDVVDFVYSANVCTISPKSQGQCTITIRHPKAAFDQQIVVTVQEYSDFAFPATNATITQGDVKFYSMQIPNTKVATHVEYSVDNPSVCSISGTKATAQVTAVGAGSTTIRAKLVASGTGVVQAESEMLVYVKKAEVNAAYITSASTIYTVNKGKSATLNAVLSGSGITNSDQYNLKWTTGDTDVVQIAGIKSDGTIAGQSIYITALKAGEALITCSHEKAASDLQFYVVVPGSAEKVLTLNKTYMTILKGSSGTALKATIENSESSNDYYDIEWSVQNVGNDEVCRVMGNGKSVTIYPINVGQADVIAQLPDSPSVAKCTVVVEAGKSFSFESTAARVQPFHTKKYKYIVSPPNANLTWTISQAQDYFAYRDLGCDESGVGYVELEGIKEGSGSLVCLTDGGAKGQLSVRTAWDYEFSLSGKTTFTITPEQSAGVEFRVNPVDAEIKVASTATNLFDYVLENNGDGTGKITFTPKTESKDNISISVTATNPNNGNEEIGRKTVTAKFQYASLTPLISFVSSDGNFSRYENGTLVLGDGETVSLKMSLAEKKANGQIQKVSVVNGTNGISVSKEIDNGDNRIVSVSFPEDKLLYGYNVTEAYKPVYCPNNDGGIKVVDENRAYNLIENWNTVLYWHQERDNYGFQNKKDDDWYGLVAPQTNSYINENGGDMVATANRHKYLCYWYDDNKGGYDAAPTYSNWFAKKRDRSFERFFTVDEFQSIAYWYVQAYSGHDMDIGARILTDHVTATYGASPEKTLTGTGNGGYLEVLILHNGSTQKAVKIPIVYETRNCSKNQD